MESYSVKAVLSALDKNFTSTMAKANLLLDGMNQKNKTLSATSGKVTSGFKSVAAALGVIKVASAAFNVLSNSMDKAVSRYDTLNRFPKVLQQIGFSAEDSSQAMKELSDGTKGLPTALDEVASTAQRIAVLTGNLKKATKTTIALNDAFLTSGSSTDDAKRGLTQYIQMLSKGSVDIMSWRTLQETMGVALNDVAKAFGYAGVSAQNDLYDALKSGEITFDQFNEKLIELDGGVNGFAARAKTASGGIATAFKNAQTAVTRGMTGILSAIDTVLQSNGLTSMLTLVGAIGNAVISLAPQLLLCGLSILESLTQGILNNMPVILTGISALFDNLTSAITTYLPQMIQQGLVIIENLATGIALALPEIIAAAINTITALVDTLSSNTGQVIDSAVRIINTLADGLLNNLPKILSAAAKLVVAIAKAIITNLPQILTAGIQIVSKLTSGLISATPQVLSAAGKVVTGVFNAFTKTNWLSVGVNIIRGIANGISSSAGALWNAAKGVLGSFKDKVLAFFGIHSPARWGVYVGKMIDLGVGGGLEKYTSKISNVAAKVFDVVSDTFTTGNMNFEALAADGIGTFTIRDMCRKDVQLQEQGGTFENKMKYTIYVPVEIDGKQVAKASAVYTQEELEKLDKQNRRKSGVR